MGTIRVEFVPVQKFGLGLFGLDHLHVVYQDETSFTDSQDYWYVLEGIQDGFFLGGTLGALGENGRTSLSVANGGFGDELIDKIGTPEDRGSRILTTGATAIATWDQLAAYGADIQDQALPYIALSLPFSSTPTINSTSFIASVLWSIGIDLNTVMPFGLRASPGASTLIGSSDADDIQIGGNFTELVTGTGGDTLRGTGANEKFYGGLGDDVLQWSPGNNIIHGGQPRLAYSEDGIDTVDYSGVGQVTISANKYAIEHKISTYVAEFSSGRDQLFSIEQVAWDQANDVIIAGDGVEFLQKSLLLDLKGDGGGRGDELGFAGSDEALLINAVNDTTISIQTLANAGDDAGYWAQSVEWLQGSDGDDRIYVGASVVGVEGGVGNDVIDARLVTPFSGLSPDGYDIEIYGGDGDDIVVSGEGRTVAYGGAGSDSFVLSAFTTGEHTVEFVIEDADASDFLFVPYDFLQETRGDFDGSRLVQVSGGPFKLDDVNTQTAFTWGTPGPSFNFQEFVGAVTFMMDGSDLVISLVQGFIEEFTIDYGPGEPPGPTFTAIVGDAPTEAIVRVKNWSEGDLGISFPLDWDPDIFNELEDFSDYPGLDGVRAEALAPYRFRDPLEVRPDAYVPLEIASALSGGSVASARNTFSSASTANIDGGDGDDILFADAGGPYTFNGGAGNDDITGSAGADTLIGGAGDDVMRGERGNDTYSVDSVGDVVIEQAGSGFDRVISVIDYTLGDHVENLALVGSAVIGTGNALRNTLEGNDLDNSLSGGDGDDTLAGNLGDDTLIGGSGSDGYVYELGDGRDIIIETADLTTEDILVLLGDIAPNTVSLLRHPDHLNDLIFAFEDGGRVTIKDYFLGEGHGIEGVQFESGDIWNAANLSAFAAQSAVTSNTAPVARNDAFAIRSAGSVTIPLLALIDNDEDLDGDALSVIALDQVTGGSATIDANGDILVTANAGDEVRSVSFQYTISDGRGGAARATFELGIIADIIPEEIDNTAPIIRNARLGNVREDQSANGRIVVRDSDGDDLIYAVKDGAGPSRGSVVFSTDGRFTYTPDADANGSDSFTLIVSDGIAAPVEQSFSFDIRAVNDVPQANDDVGYTVQRGMTLRISAEELLTNDVDVDGNALDIISVSRDIGGRVSRDSNGDILFTARNNFTGEASFTYRASDGAGGRDTATVTINVMPDAVEPSSLSTQSFRSVLDGDIVQYPALTQVQRAANTDWEDRLREEFDVSASRLGNFATLLHDNFAELVSLQHAHDQPTSEQRMVTFVEDLL
ncbi:MAG: hypothetical protein CTY31_04750 [Hyphomicrobium sp.]|nr:MAG: hypothetical protein CTY39_00660 [Hyphomicrobium sp.]PPD00444.1 MAG: hypothetical protein CTY31_04750 [Hyphomicrobium sp.]